jgi:hypothetical protein
LFLSKKSEKTAVFILEIVTSADSTENVYNSLKVILFRKKSYSWKYKYFINLLPTNLPFIRPHKLDEGTGNGKTRIQQSSIQKSHTFTFNFIIKTISSIHCAKRNRIGAQRDYQRLLSIVKFYCQVKSLFISNNIKLTA